MALYAINKIGQKPLVIVPTSMLKKQWCEEFVELGIPKEEIATHISDAKDRKLCVVTVAALGNALREDWQGLLRMLNEANFGIKVIDEAHLNLKGVLQLEGICNIKRNWYMSATLGRSNEAEDNILNRSLLDAERFVGSAKYEEYQKEYIQVYLQDIFYQPSKQLCDKHFRYGKAGLIRASYYNMLMAYRGGRPFIENIIHMIKLMRQIVPKPKKTLVLVPLINIIQEVLKAMDHDPYFKKLTVAGIDGSMNMTAKQEALEADIILSTSMSVGTGVDIKDLSITINFDQYSSPIIIEQIVGRLRDRGEECHYVDICDHVKYAKTIMNWGRKRRMLLPYFPGTKTNMKHLPRIVNMK